MSNEPAFPHSFQRVNKNGYNELEFTPGMSIRDHFAAAALPMISQVEDAHGTIGEAAEALGIEASEYDSKKHWSALVAKRAYQYADAMISERNKANQQPIQP